MSTEDKGAPANPDPDSVQAVSKRARQRIAKAARADEASGDAVGSKPKRSQRRGKGSGTASASKESGTTSASKGSTADSVSKGVSTSKAGGTGDTSSSSRTGERKRGGKGARNTETMQQPGAKSQAGSSTPASGEEPVKGRSRGRRRTNGKAGAQPESAPVSAGDEQGGAKTPSEAKPRTPRRARAGRPAREAETSGSAGGPVTVAVRDADRECGDCGRAAQVNLPRRDAGVERLDPATKVCVRWLPADLPEHVFWQSVEPSLPWFDASHTGSVVEHKRLVLVTTEPSANTDTALETPSPHSTEATDAGTPISPHAATTTGTLCVYESANVSRLDIRPYWRQFIAGKQYKSRAKAAEPSRAYIVFSTASEAREFHHKYHGHTFTKNGMQSRARVEQAMFQCVAVTDAVDPLEGSIDDDPAFRAFLDPNEHAKREVPARASYATATAADAGTGEDVTPLIQYLRKLKAKRMPRGVPQQPKAAAKAAVKAVAKAAPKAPQGAAKGAASKKPKDDSTKKPRRQNR